ncbi:hypothetical protein MLD38_024665 [Melastoma candidum]|uniref:Uncharacterized protein n=1 Tax=Melastoma candidum TaxID=119954 RepID=A0ACB9NTY3_9MYRT|nr:hypothetical protein MLD38_024665 [Melastoma candidum]
MEGDPGSGFSPRLFDWNSYDTTIKPNMRPYWGNPTIEFPFQNTTPAVINTDCVLPFCGVSAHQRIGQSSEQIGWFYCLPRYRQALTSATRNLPLKDGIPVDPSANCAVSSRLYGGIDVGAEPKFFVFDQSGGQTTLVFGPENNGIPTPHIPMAGLNQLGIAVSGGEGPVDEIVSEGGDENEDVDAGSEMHEDTEELNALLYSDEDSEYSGNGDDDDEVTSTGHSPSTMTDHLDPNNTLSVKDSEEVASSQWPLSKKRKLANEQHDPLPLIEATLAENQIRDFDTDDAISSSGDSRSISRNHAIKRTRIRETVSVLQSLVPGVKGKDPVLILDEAIGYLKLLKRKAAALGLSQL